MYVIMSSLRDFSIPEAYKQIRSMDTLARLELPGIHGVFSLLKQHREGWKAELRRDHHDQDIIHTGTLQPQ